MSRENEGRGYLESKDQEQEARGRHVEADGDEAGEGWQQVEKERLVQALQEVVEFAEHALQSPAEHSWSGPAILTPARLCFNMKRGPETYLPTATKSYLY